MSPTIYLPEDPDYTLVDSVRDSVRFAHYCLEPGSHGRWFIPSCAVRRDGAPAEGHPLFGLEGPGGEANALGGSLTLYRWARFDQNHILEKVAVGLLDHVLEDGFLQRNQPPRLYRNAATGEFFLNSVRGDDWYSPADHARIALQLLGWADALSPSDRRVNRLREEAAIIGQRLENELAADTWPPAKRFVTGEAAGTAGAEGLYLACLMMEMEERGLARTSESARSLVESFVRSGGVYGWRLSELASDDATMGRALAMRSLRRAAERFRNPALWEFALAEILPALVSRVLTEDRGALPATGLVCSDSGCSTALMADAAECSIACQEAADSTRDRDHMCAGVTMLRAVARFHRIHAEPHGYLAAGLGLGSAPAVDLPPDSFTTALYSNLLHVDAALYYLSRRVS